MKRFIAVASLIFLMTTGWSLGQKLSADALSMGIGIFFGILASVPASLLLVAASRRSDHSSRSGRSQHDRSSPGGYQTPVIVLAPPMAGYGTMPGQPNQGSQQFLSQLPPAEMVVDSSAQRQFRVIGEDDDWVDEY